MKGRDEVKNKNFNSLHLEDTWFTFASLPLKKKLQHCKTKQKTAKTNFPEGKTIQKIT